MLRPQFLLLLSVTACVRTTPQPSPELPPPAPRVVVPEGCLEGFAGPWVHATDPGYRYQGEDDGGTLTLIVSHVARPDAGFSPRRFRAVDAGVEAQADAGVTDAGLLAAPGARVELRRTERGFVGETIAPLTHPTGRTCEGHFPTTVVNCADGGLLLETQSATALGDACQTPARPLGLLTQQHQLWRPDGG